MPHTPHITASSAISRIAVGNMKRVVMMSMALLGAVTLMAQQRVVLRVYDLKVDIE